MKYYQTSSHSYTRWCRVGLERFDERRLARRKSPVLTAQTTLPLHLHFMSPSRDLLLSNNYNNNNEVLAWSEQLRSVTSVWLGAARRSIQVRLCTSGCKSEKMFGENNNLFIYL